MRKSATLFLLIYQNLTDSFIMKKKSIRFLPVLKIGKRSAFTLVEASVAMVLLTIVVAMIAFSSASFEKTFLVYDGYSALADELSRQAELAKGMPMQALTNRFPNGVTVSLPLPALTIVSSNIQSTYTNLTINPLNGFLPINGTTGITPNVTWTVTNTNFSVNAGHTTYYHVVNIDANVTLGGQLLDDHTTVTRLFDALQQ